MQRSKTSFSNSPHSKVSKLAKQLINKFYYYQAHHSESPIYQKHQQTQQLRQRSSKIQASENHHYVLSFEKHTQALTIFIHKAQYLQMQMQSDAHRQHQIKRQQIIKIITKAILKTYFKHGTIKIDGKYWKSTPIQMSLKIKILIQTFQKYKHIDQIVQIVQNSQGDEQDVQFFILHHANLSSNISNTVDRKVNWNNFIQRYVFNGRVIKHQAIGTIEKTKPLYEKSLFKELFEQYTNKRQVSEVIQNYQKAKSYFYQKQTEKVVSNGQQHSAQSMKTSQRVQEIISDPAYSEIHKRTLKLPPEYYQTYSTLKAQFKDTQITENDICRYLFVNDYDQEAVRQVLNQYLEFRKQLKQQFNQKDYQEFRDLNLIKYIGEDFEGRPVILFLARNFKADELDLDKFIKQIAYFMQYQIPSKRRGYVDTHISINDYLNLSSENINFQAMKKLMSSGMKFGPQRSYKIFGVNLNTLAYGCYRTLKPFIPDRTLQKLTIVGEDKQEIMKSLLTMMDQQVIPDYLGGKNKIQLN